MAEWLMFVGTYTRTGSSRGIYTFRMDDSGGMTEVAIEWLGRAGQWAAARDSHYAAAQFYRRAIEMLGDADLEGICAGNLERILKGGAQ